MQLKNLDTRENLAELFAKLNFTKGAEIGVERGFFSEILLKCNSGLKLYCVDPWIPYFKVSARRQKMLFSQARQRLALYNVEYIRKTSMEALNDIPDGSLDFVYIDALHDFENVSKDIVGWEKKVRSGGIVSGHDYVYLRRRNLGIIPAVDNFVEANHLLLYLTKDELPSWFWMKP